MKKRFLSMFLTLCMVLTLLPMVAMATGWDGTWDKLGTGNIGFNYGATGHLIVTMPTTTGHYTYGTTSADGLTVSQTATDAAILPASGWQWAVQKRAADANGIEFTLMLNNATITCTTDDYHALMFNVGLKINLVGSNSVTASTSWGTAICGFSNSKLLISDAGSGSLTCTGQYGFYVSGDLTFLSGIVSATGSSTGIMAAGTAKITISGGTVTAVGTTIGISTNNGTPGMKFFISGGTVTATGGSMMAFGSDVTLINCTATASTDISGTGAGAYSNASRNTFKYVHTVPKSTMPAATVTTVAKTAATQTSVDFALTSAPSGTYSVYADNSTATVHSTVTAAFSGNTLTLTDSGDNIATGTYYVSFSDGTNPESDRLALTVGANVPPTAISAISGVTPPVAGDAPVTTITDCAQYTGTVTWSGSPTTFANSTPYTATITLAPKTGYTLTGVTENFFTVAGANEVTNSANSGSISVIFPKTGKASTSEQSWGGVSSNGIGFNYGINKFINITMPTEDNYYTYGTASDGTAAEIASNAKTLPTSGWNWAVKKETTTVDGVTYDYTLTLKNFEINSTTTTKDGLMFKTSLKLVLIGTNVINTPNGGSALSGNNTGCNLHISGDGSLTATGEKIGINGSGTFTISGGTIEASSTYAYGAGIVGVCGVTISDGTVTASNSAGDGIRTVTDSPYNGTISITGGTVTAKGGTSAVTTVPTLINVAALGSENNNGSGAVIYNQANSDDYKWFKSGKIVTYAGNDNTGGSVPDSQIYPSSETVTVPGNTGNLVKSGFTFAGWNDGTNTYQPGATYTMPANNVTFTAQWTQNAPSGGAGSVTSTDPVIRIDNGGSTTGANLERLVSAEKPLTVEDKSGAKLVFNTEALKGIGNQTSGDIKVEMQNVSPTHQVTLPGKQVFSLAVSSGSSPITNFGGAVTVTLPYTLRDGETAQEVTVWYLANDGTMTEIPCTYDLTTKLATFSVTHFSLYVVGVDTPWINPFTDVKDSDWFYGAVEFVSRNGMMQGIGGPDFSPNTTITRAMLVTILWRLENEPATTKTISFADVSDSKWYAKAVAWGAENNIVTGYDGKFNPDDALTREQLAAILYRYAAYKNYDVSAADSLSAYADKPSDWALSSVNWAVAKGLIKGSGSSLDPTGSATRAQAATILQRFIENTVYLRT